MSVNTVRRCDFCNIEVILPYHCSYCGLYFCDKHRLPENHSCLSLPSRDWNVRKRMLSEKKYGKPKSAVFKKDTSDLSVDISDPVKDDVRYRSNRKKKIKYKKHQKLGVLIKILFAGLLLCGGSVIAWKAGVFSEEIDQKFDELVTYLDEILDNFNIYLQGLLTSVTDFISVEDSSEPEPELNPNPDPDPEPDPEPLRPYESINDLIRFLVNDDVSDVVYASDFKCGDFAEALVNRAYDVGYDLRVYSMFNSELDDFIRYVESLEYTEAISGGTMITTFIYGTGSGHALCSTTIDSEVYLVEPQSDMVYKVVNTGYEIMYFGEVTKED